MEIKIPWNNVKNVLKCPENLAFQSILLLIFCNTITNIPLVTFKYLVCWLSARENYGFDTSICGFRLILHRTPFLCSVVGAYWCYTRSLFSDKNSSFSVPNFGEIFYAFQHFMGIKISKYIEPHINIHIEILIFKLSFTPIWRGSRISCYSGSTPVVDSTET